MPADIDEHRRQMLADHRIVGLRVLFDEGAHAAPDILRKLAELRPGEQIALQLLGALGVVPGVAQPIDEAVHETVEFLPHRMIGIGPHLLEQRAGGGDDLLQQIGVGAEQVEQRRQLLADPLAHRRQRLLVVQESADDLGELVEQLLVPAVVGEGRQQVGRERRELHLLDLVEHALLDEVAQAGLLDGRQRLRHQPGDETRQAGGALGTGQPVGDKRGEIDLLQLFANRSGRQEIHLDEAAEIVGDAVLVGGNDRRVRDRQAERPPEQRDHRIPVGEAADRRRFGECRDEGQPGPPRLRNIWPARRSPRRDRARRSRWPWCAEARRAFPPPPSGGSRYVSGRCRHDIDSARDLVPRYGRCRRGLRTSAST